MRGAGFGTGENTSHDHTSLVADSYSEEMSSLSENTKKLGFTEMNLSAREFQSQFQLKMNIMISLAAKDIPGGWICD